MISREWVEPKSGGGGDCGEYLHRMKWRTIFKDLLKNHLARNVETCVKTLSGNVDSHFFK